MVYDKEFVATVLNKPPYVNLKGVDKPPERLANSGKEMAEWYRRDPRLRKWIEYGADVGGHRKEMSGEWPDELEEWEDEVDALVEEGTVPHPGAGMTWLYENNEHYRKAADALWEEERQYVAKWNRKRLFWVLNRAAWTVVWSARISRPAAGERKRARE